MGKMIRWSMKDPAGCIQRGQMSLSQLPGILLSFENSAAETLRRTGSDHVLYAVKIYNAADELTAVQFYMNPMSDEEFHKLAGRGRGTMVYGEYTACEIGFPNREEELIKQYAEDPEDLTETVYAYVPVEVIDEVIKKHGGFERKEGKR